MVSPKGNFVIGGRVIVVGVQSGHGCKPVKVSGPLVVILVLKILTVVEGITTIGGHVGHSSVIVKVVPCFCVITVSLAIIVVGRGVIVMTSQLGQTLVPVITVPLRVDV